VSEKLGVSDLKDVLQLGLIVRNDAVKALDDGKITLGDLPTFADVIPAAAKAISGVQNIPLEVADLSSQELDELHAWTKENYGVGDEHVKEVVADCLELGLKVASVVLKALKVGESKADAPEVAPA